MHLSSTFLMLAISLLCFCTTASPAQPPDDELADVTSRWDAIARAHIRPGKIGDVSLNVVDYTAIAADPRWEELLAAYQSAQEPADSKQKLAFWINAYNVMAINVVLSKYPVKSIKDIGSWTTPVWEVEAGVVVGKTRTLNEIEHGILRKMGDPRIHGAIVCASVSCPPIRPEAYTPDRLDQQLDDQMRAWLSNPRVGASIEKDGSVLRVSSIFKWFPEDFEEEAGSVKQFVSRYLSAAQKATQLPDALLSYLGYDWSLNDAARSVNTGG